MFFIPNSDPTSECRRINRDSSDQAMFFQSNTVHFWWTCANCILRFLFLADRSGTGVVFCCWSPSASGFNVLCVQRWCSAYPGCNVWLFELLLLFYHLYPVCPFSSDLWHQQGIFIHTTVVHWIFYFFGPFSVNPRFVCEYPSRSSVLEILRAAHLAPTTIPRSKSLKSPFFPILMLGLNFSKSSSPHLDA